MTLKALRRRADPIFAALGDPTRRAIVYALAERPARVSDLARAHGVTLSAIGQHMAALEACGLAQSEKRGRERICRLDPQGLAALQSWVDAHRAIWDERLNRLGEALDEP